MSPAAKFVMPSVHVEVKTAVGVHVGPDQRRQGRVVAWRHGLRQRRRRAKTFCEDGNVAMLDSFRLMAGLTLSENTCFPTGRQGLLELPI